MFSVSLGEGENNYKALPGNWLFLRIFFIHFNSKSVSFLLSFLQRLEYF